MKTATVALNDIEMFYETDGGGEPCCFFMAGEAVTKTGFMPAAKSL
jgi:hypothetical protein